MKHLDLHPITSPAYLLAKRNDQPCVRHTELSIGFAPFLEMSRCARGRRASAGAYSGFTCVARHCMRGQSGAKTGWQYERLANCAGWMSSWVKASPSRRWCRMAECTTVSPRRVRPLGTSGAILGHGTGASTRWEVAWCLAPVTDIATNNSSE
jgi:hypothetical protein